jgi:hypothetical protein
MKIFLLSCIEKRLLGGERAQVKEDRQKKTLSKIGYVRLIKAKVAGGGGQVE